MLQQPRESRVQFGQFEKSYWRTRDRIQYALWEDRRKCLIFITCYNVESKQSYRTIFLDANKLYQELEFKAKGNREPTYKKKEKKFIDDTALFKAASDYISARLNIKADPLPWPSFLPPDTTTVSSNTTIAGTGNESAENNSLSTTQDSQIQLATERMCLFERLSGDEYDYLEVPAPPGYSAEGVTHSKFFNDAPADAPLEVLSSSISEAVAAVSAAASVSSIPVPKRKVGWGRYIYIYIQYIYKIVVNIVVVVGKNL
jgi:hypothetical protein